MVLAPGPDGERAAFAMQALIDHLSQGAPVVVLSGSGISAESGVPTFRDAQQGIWARFRPEDLATPAAFAADPVRVWRWYAWRRELVARAEPNAAHHALVRWQRAFDNFHLITQNVDGLHQRAGSEAVVEFHGNLMANRCTACRRALSDAECVPAEPPLCAHCGGAVRPDVVWFGETIPAAALVAAERATSACATFVSVGTSSLVWPAAGYAEQALRNGATLVEINPAATPLTPHVHYRFAAAATEVLPELVAGLLAARAGGAR